MINKIQKFITNKYYRFGILQSKGFFKRMDDRKYLEMMYQFKLGKPLNLDDPKSFNEKLQWLKLHDHNPLYTQMVDKYEAKKYVANIIGDQYIIPTLGVWNKFDDIDFSRLPNQFVLKCTHDSGGLIIVRDKSKLDIKNAKAIIDKSLKRNYYWSGREWPYKNVPRKIIAEQYMEDEAGELQDYKFMCFNGNVKCSFVCSDRFSKEGLHVTNFDPDWNVMPFERHYPAVRNGLPKPSNYDQMIKLAEKLAAGLPFIRVDFYNIGGKIYFGELTFFPASGFEEFEPEEWDYKLGSWIKLPN